MGYKPPHAASQSPPQSHIEIHEDIWLNGGTDLVEEKQEESGSDDQFPEIPQWPQKWSDGQGGDFA